MATITRFEDLEVWRLARCLTASIYRLTADGVFARDFGLRDQIRRAAVSIVSNIAEGFERNSNVQFLSFLNMANGSAGEVRAQLYIALDCGYINSEQFQEQYVAVVNIGKKIVALMNYLRSVPNRLDK